ncbi:hypothetical protein BBJ28_00026436 [Nothophytophthora sp. Chile5]|nr:hypothetical protein BBJ28_00026436 [Nothophytophthora sp. Chile5]
MRDADPARVNMDRYLAARAKQITSAIGCKTETSPAADAPDGDVLAQLLFERLPTVAAQLLATPASSSDASETCFFNEHYVVKPPQSHVEFRWHRDDDEQLGMCLHRDALPPYVSAWCALDDVTTVNGALQFASLAASDSENESVESLQRRASPPLSTQAGDVLFFLSNVWHCSSSNESDAPRRAFYAQYSSGRITAGPNDPAPLSFAIPCVSTSVSASLEACTDASAAPKKRKIDASGS